MGKFRCKTLNDGIDGVSDLTKGKVDPEFCDYPTSVVERYKRLDCRIHMHARGALNEFCAIFQHTPSMPNRGVGAAPMSETNCGSLRNHDLYQPMLVRIIDFMEPPKGTIARATLLPTARTQPTPVPAVVWLQPLDHCLVFFAQRINLSASVFLEGRHLNEFTFEVAPFSLARSEKEYREFGIGCRCLAGGIVQNELIDQLIKSRPKIVRNLANIDSPVKGGGLSFYAHAVDVISRLRIDLCFGDVINGVLPEGVLGESETLDFTFCTPYLEARAFQIKHMLYSNHERQEDANDAQGSRNPRAKPRGLSKEPRPSSENSQETFTASTLSEPKSET